MIMHHVISRSVFASALALGLSSVSAHAVAMPQNEPEEQNQAQADDSQQPVGDAWITTKVKADLLATEDVSGLDIKVETMNGVVTLSGQVANQAQIDKAVSVAQGIKGVVRVDSSGLNVGTP